MYWPLYLLHTAFGFGSRELSAPQAGLMATLAIGIVGGDMPWPLVVVGVCFGIALIMMQVKSPMLVAVGMYLPFETTFAIFLGGVFRSIGDWMAKRRGLNAAQHARAENAGVLTASGLIAGEAICGLLWAGVIAMSYAQQPWLRLASGWADLRSSAIPRRNYCDDSAGGADDLSPALQRRRPERTRAANSDDVKLQPRRTLRRTREVFIFPS
jgi:hypothetical protein